MKIVIGLFSGKKYKLHIVYQQEFWVDWKKKMEAQMKYVKQNPE